MRATSNQKLRRAWDEEGGWPVKVSARSVLVSIRSLASPCAAG